MLAKEMNFFGHVKKVELYGGGEVMPFFISGLFFCQVNPLGDDWYGFFVCLLKN